MSEYVHNASAPFATEPQPASDLPGISRRGLLRGGGLLSLAAAGVALDPGLLTPAEAALTPAGDTAVDLDILYIGAHPDDEAWTLPAFGQWNEYHRQEAGVITITRGEGGGNAVGLEEGPSLGLRRELEERRAVGRSGIKHVFNLDAVDFFYTMSAPLSYDVWGGEAVLNRIVRVIRATRPDIIITMNPSAVEGNHGNHQRAAMYAVEAYLMAGRDDVFPEHFDEGFRPWAPKRILRSGSTGKGDTGPDAIAEGFDPAVASDVVYGAWNGTESKKHGKRWSELGDLSIWDYQTQGWAAIPATPTEPAKIPTAWFTLIDSRTPLADPRSGSDALLRGATLPIDGGLDAGTILECTASSFYAVPGEDITVDITLSAPKRAVPHARAAIDLPDGWTSSGPAQFPTIAKGRTATASVTVTPSKDATPGDAVALRVNVTTKNRGTAWNTVPLRVAGAVEAILEPRPEIAEFLDWTKTLHMQQLDALVPTRRALGSGLSKETGLRITNRSATVQDAQVALTLPDGVAAEPAQHEVRALAAGESTTATLTLTNTNPDLPTANRAPDGGVYPVTITTSTASTTAALENGLYLVPHLTAVRTGGVTVDGKRSKGEYPGDPIDIGTLWEGEEVTKADASGSTWVSFDDEALHIHVDVTDDKQGALLVAEDDKQRFRTDSIEIMIDPQGTAQHTGSTFILAVVPQLDDPENGNPLGAGRDRDAHQGPLKETAPGVEVAARVKEPYTGYEIEVTVPFTVLPDAIRADSMGFNVVVYDSDTTDRTGQSRIGWSTFPGVQADPYRWGVLTLPGLPNGESNPVEPIIPRTAAQSTLSPTSIIQSATDGVPLAGRPPLPAGTIALTNLTGAGRDRATVELTVSEAGAGGELRLFLWDPEKRRTLGTALIHGLGAGKQTVSVRLDDTVQTLVAAASLVKDEAVAAAATEGAF
ncbi:sugar-binding protein [Helcobacillus massiliensis]|uniref:sugar-binding protein n=1 Tax=Helcobacillus massiliensis TaxID=521392 RepID=UPI0016082293|nr:sugar-binding protein [Helcobacillus massiliensis]